MPDFTDLPLLLTVPEVAALLRTTPKAVYAMKERGQLPGVVVLGARAIRVRRDKLLGWLSREPSSEKE